MRLNQASTHHTSSQHTHTQNVKPAFAPHPTSSQHMPLTQRQASTHPTSRQNTSIVRAAYIQRQDSTCPHPMSSYHIPLLRRQGSICPSSNVRPAHILHQDSILLATGKQFHANTCYYMARKIIINRDYLLVIFFLKNAKTVCCVS